MDDIIVQARELRKCYGAVTAVDGVSLEIRKGEMLGLLGPNGAGKSTTIHLLTGTLRPDSGEVQIAGTSDPTRPEARRCIGVAPQALSLYEELTGEENLAFFGRLYGLAGTFLRARVDWALEFSGLAEQKGRRVSTYSGGMQRRLNMACALVHDPPILLLDEPTVGVDPQSRNHIFERIEVLRAEGRTVLYTTHYMEEAQRLCDRVAIMDHGKILALDSVETLIERYGGSSLIEATFTHPPAFDCSLAAQLEGTKLRLESKCLAEDIARLATANAPLLTLNVRRPDLETVFLSLTGRRLRD